MGQKLLQKWVMQFYARHLGDVMNNETVKHLHTKLGINSKYSGIQFKN